MIRHNHLASATLATLTACALSFGLTTGAQAAVIDDDPSNGDYLTQASRFVDGLQQLGISSDDLPTVPSSETAYLDAFAEYVMNSSDSATTANVQPSVTAVSTTTCDDGGRFDHAHDAAVSNSAVDGNAKDIGTETVYMYLSHYVDMPNSQLGTTCDANDVSQYLAN